MRYYKAAAGSIRSGSEAGQWIQAAVLTSAALFSSHSRTGVLWSRELPGRPLWGHRRRRECGAGMAADPDWTEEYTAGGQMDQGRRSVSQLKSTGWMRKGSDRWGRERWPARRLEGERAGPHPLSLTHTPHPVFFHKPSSLSRTTHICPLPGLALSSSVCTSALTLRHPVTYLLSAFLQRPPPRSNLFSSSALKSRNSLWFTYAFSALHTGGTR